MIKPLENLYRVSIDVLRGTQVQGGLGRSLTLPAHWGSVTTVQDSTDQYLEAFVLGLHHLPTPGDVFVTPVAWHRIADGPQEMFLRDCIFFAAPGEVRSDMATLQADFNRLTHFIKAFYNLGAGGNEAAAIQVLQELSKKALLSR